jgi:hypothetical protein
MAGVTSLLHTPRLRRNRAQADRVRAVHSLLDRVLDAGVTVGEIEAELNTLLRWAKERRRGRAS